MPARIALAPGTIPAQDVLRLGSFPQGEVLGMALVVAHVHARARFLVVQATVGKLAVLRPAIHVEVDVALLGDVGISLLDQRLDHLDLIGDMATGPRADVRAHHAQRIHVLEIAAGVGFHDLHRQGLRLTGLFQDAILARIQQMPHVGQVLHIEHVIAAPAQIAYHHIERNIRLGVAYVRVIVDRRAADVHVHLAFVQRFKGLFLTMQDVVDLQGHGTYSLELAGEKSTSDCSAKRPRPKRQFSAVLSSAPPPCTIRAVLASNRAVTA